MSKTVNAEGNETVMKYHENGVDLKDYTAITGESFEYTYNSLHQVTSVTKTVGDSTQTADYTYDRYGNTTSVTLSASGSNLKITSSAAYSADGNYLVSTVNELGKTTSYNYDNVTKLLTYVQNANNVHTAYVYDNRDRTTKVYLDADKDGVPDTAEAQVAYLYANNRLSGIDTATTDYTLTYDAFGNVLTIKAGNYVLATYEYAGNNGKLKKLTYGNGDYEEYVYDILERLVSVKLNGVTEYIVKYDSNGRLYSLTESGSTHIYEYDSLDRLVRAWQENASGKVIISVENSYDDLGRISGSKYGDVSTTAQQYSITYKEDCNLVDTYTMPGNKVNTYTYDEFERLVTKAHSSDVYTTRYSYVTDADGNTSSLVSQLDIDTNTSDACFTYAYNNLGYISSISKNGSVIASYTYDALGQLTTEINRETSRVYNYTYDKSGNITQKSVYDYSTGSMLESFSYIYNNATWGDLLGVYNGKIILYDAIGNPINWRNASSLTWEGRELQGITLSDTKSVTYGYNSSGVRTRRSYVETNGNTWQYTYVLDGSKIMRESVQAYATSSPGAGMSYTMYYYYDDSGVAAVSYNGTRYYYVKNLQGDVIGLVNSSGNYVVKYSYDAWGNIVSTTGSMASSLGDYNPFRYRSYYYDVETGFYYLQSRYYDPTVGRFLNADGIIGANGGIEGYNMFAYCNNNPVMYADALGYAMRYNTVMINDGGSERTTWVDRCLRSLAEQRERLTRCCASIAQTVYYDTIPDFARDWSSPVDHADYHNSAECAAFGYPRGDRKHKGVDFYPSDSGTNAYGADGTAKNVYAMSSGSVYMVSSSFYKNSGALHVIQDDGYYVIYGEIDASGWSVGDRINKGQLIGIMQRADSIGDPSLMLHLEIYADGARRPENLIDPTFVYRLVDRYVYD